jgi:hypothetical protein
MMVYLRRRRRRERGREFPILEKRVEDARDPGIGHRARELADPGQRHLSGDRSPKHEVSRVHVLRPALRAGDLEPEIPAVVLYRSTHPRVFTFDERGEEAVDIVEHHRGQGTAPVDERNPKVGTTSARRATLDPLDAEELVDRVPDRQLGAEDVFPIRRHRHADPVFRGSRAARPS